MILEGVNFIVRECQKMPKGKFIRMHIDKVWLDRDISKRRRMLSDAYDIFSPPKKTE